MVAVTRWVQYDPSAVGSTGDGRGAGCRGTRGFAVGTASVGDTFTIGSSNRLYLSMDGDSGPYITLYSGASLDPRFIAKDITEKMHALGKSDARWDNAVCRWENYFSTGNRFKIYSGTLGSSSSVTIASGTNSAHVTLGFSNKVEQGGMSNHMGAALPWYTPGPGAGGTYGFSGDVTISGTYYGFLDEMYTVVITNDNDTTRGIGTASVGASNSYTGTMTTGGVFNYGSDIQYVIAIDVTNGATMGAGTGNVPTMTWTSTSNFDDSSASTELLYPDHWYNIGMHGLKVKFTDAVFNTCNPAWTIQCYKPDYAQGSNITALPGIAKYTWTSDRGDDNQSSPLTTSSGSYTRLGTRGVYIRFEPQSGSDTLQAGDEFRVLCAAPAPLSYNITSLNYGNVTVSTESDIKTVMFEVESGAVEVSTVKFGLQSHGTFSHHNAGNSDTYFRFGTIGPATTAGIAPTNGYEWYPNIASTDIDSDTPPSYLYATEDNLPEVADADSSEAVGNTGLMSDAMWLCIRLGAAETGANSTINYRLYFDYS